MNTNGIIKRISATKKTQLVLSALLALAGGCNQGALDAEGLRIPAGYPGSEPEAISQHDGTERGGTLLAAAPAAVEPDSDEATVVIAADAEEPALEAAPQLVDSEDEAVAVDAEESEESDGSSPSRTETEMRVATESFSAGDPLEFGTHTQLAPVGLVPGGAEPYFGYPVLVQGDRMLVGAWADAEQAPGQGAAFVFERNMEGVWEQDIKLMASDADVEPTAGSWGASFGYTMSMDGDRLAIGAGWDDGDEGELDAGAVYIYELITDAWVQTKVRAPSQVEFESFGDAVEISGDWLFVHGRDAGEHAVHVYHRVNNVWTFTEMLTSPLGSNEQYEFGLSLASAGDTLFVSAVRAPGGTTDWFETEYSVYVFEQSGGTWSQTDQLFASNHTAANGFGMLAFDGSTLVVGAPYFSGTEAYQGAAYAFENDGDSWEEVAPLTAPTPRANGLFGYSVAVDGDSFAIGTGHGDSADSISVYEREVVPGPWTHNQTVVVSDVVESHSGAPFFGLFGGQLFLGLPHGTTDEAAVGAVYALTGAAL